MSVFDAMAADLRACEETLLDPAVRRDRTRVAALLADDFVEFGSSGRAWTREEILELLASEEFQRPRIEGFECTQIADGVVLVTYRAVRVDTRGDRSITLRSSVWSIGPSGWRLRFHQGTRAI